MAGTTTLGGSITRGDLNFLLQPRPGPTVSIYHPTEPAAVEPETNSLHLKNLLAQASEELLRQNVRRPDVDGLLQPARDLLDDKNFWRHQQRGLAVFCAKDFFRYFRLPFTVEERVNIGDGAYVKPLLPALTLEGHFFVLALSQNTTRLFRATQTSIEEIDLEPFGMPTSLEEALRYDDLQKPDESHHPVTGPGRGAEGLSPTGEAPGQRRHAFHGHGADVERHDTQIRRFFQVLEDGVFKALRDENAPLLLAGVEYLHPIFRDVARYKPILEKGVFGNPEGLRAEELHTRAWEVVQPHFRGRIREAKERWFAGFGRGTASCTPEEVLQAAQHGRVAALFARRNAEIWGVFNPADGSVEAHAERQIADVDLVDLACRKTLETSGDVFVVEEADMPCDGDLAALFRY